MYDSYRNPKNYQIQTKKVPKNLKFKLLVYNRYKEVHMNIMNSTLKYGSENIASELRRGILNGQILAPEKLPAERELARNIKYQEEL